MKKTFRPLIAAAALLFVLAGCDTVAAGTPDVSFASIAQIQRTETDMTILGNDAIQKGLYWEENPIIAYQPKKGGVWYPRLFVTRAGVMLCAFDTNEDGGHSKIKLVSSTDGGLTWENKVTVSEFAGLDCANAAFAQLPDGTLFVACRANVQKSDGYYSSIRVSESLDGGKTWGYHSTIAEELGEGGVYEPHFGWIGDTLAVFYANDSLNVVNERSQQSIEFKLYASGAWSEKRIASDGITTRSRDGMPVWTKMENGRYALVIEATNVSGYPFVIQMKTSPDGLNWSEENRNIYIPYAQTKKAGAPYIATLPDGRLCVAFQTDDEASQTGDSASYMKVMVSTDEQNEGTAFSTPYIPFLMPEGRCANWNALYVFDGYLYAATSANAPKGGIYLKRAALEPKTQPGQNVIVNGNFMYKNTQGWVIGQKEKVYHAGFASKQFENNSGNYALTLINNKSADLTLYQEIPGVQKGSYAFRMKMRGEGGEAVTLSITQGTETIQASCVPGPEGVIWEIPGIRLQSGPAVIKLTQPAAMRVMTIDDIELVYTGTEGDAA